MFSLTLSFGSGNLLVFGLLVFDFCDLSGLSSERGCDLFNLKDQSPKTRDRLKGVSSLPASQTYQSPR